MSTLSFVLARKAFRTAALFGSMRFIVRTLAQAPVGV